MPPPTPFPLPHTATQVLYSGVGPVTINDVNLATAAGAHLVTFNLGADGLGGPGAGGAGQKEVTKALTAAKANHGITHLSHNVIYHLMDQIQGLVEGGRWGEIGEA